MRDAVLEVLEAWAERACLDLEPAEADRLFYTKGGHNELEGRRLCYSCPARVPCALRALAQDRTGDYDVVGLVGGLTAEERLELLEREGVAR